MSTSFKMLSSAARTCTADRYLLEMLSSAARTADRYLLMSFVHRAALATKKMTPHVCTEFMNVSAQMLGGCADVGMTFVELLHVVTMVCIYCVLRCSWIRVPCGFISVFSILWRSIIKYSSSFFNLFFIFYNSFFKFIVVTCMHVHSTRLRWLY